MTTKRNKMSDQITPLNKDIKELHEEKDTINIQIRSINDRIYEAQDKKNTILTEIEQINDEIKTVTCNRDSQDKYNEFLKQTNLQGIPLFVVSGSDEKELIYVFRQRGILNLFKHVYGSPLNKNDNTEKVVQRIGAQKKGCFFGDSKSDYSAASKYGLDFVFVSGLSEWKENNKSNHTNETIKNFLEICTTLQ